MGNKATRRSESFCFAISAWALLTGKQPYEDQPFITRSDEVDFVAAVTRERDPLRPDLGSLPLDMPPELRALIEECWSADRRARPLPREVARRLRGIMQSLTPTPTHSPTPVPTPAPAPGSDPLEAMRAQLTTLQARLDQVEVITVVACVWFDLISCSLSP